MAEGIDDAANAFANELKTPEPAGPPRDQAGKFVQVQDKPEPMFESRELEGDPLTGDTSDGGDDENLRARERRVADGRDLRRTDDQEVEGEGEGEDGDELQPADEGDEGNAEKYEVTVDGATHHVTLKQMLDNYASQVNLQQRAEHLSQAQMELDVDYQMRQNNWNLLIKARQDYDQDLANLIPQEPNWDQEFAINPQQAHATQKIFQTIYAKLNQSMQYRAQMEAQKAAESDRRTQKYAVEGFSKFVMDNQIPDEPTLQKRLRSMRRTAADAGFNEYEVSTVYDPRMLTVLFWASEHRRAAANKIKAVVPGKGKTLTPGAATPLGNVRRAGFDEAQRRLASSGKLSDAVDVFRRIL